ncbi:14830_t:CDS:2, partial [Funneliformis mosseae]
ILKQLYSTNYQSNERELNAWRIILYYIGCHNITLFLNQESETRSLNSDIERDTLK